MRAPPDVEALRSLGVGASFEVALGRRAGAPVVVKRARPGAPAVDPSALARERNALRGLAGRRAPALIDAGEDAAGAFVVEAFVDGPPLRAAPASPALALDVVRGLRALHEAQAADGGGLALVHGDVHPHNLLVGAAGEVIWIDFGSAGLLRVPAIGRGTLPFCAPELCRGDAPSQATDRYAAALVVAELLLGAALRLPPPSPAALVAIGEAGHELGPLRGLPAPLASALAAALAFEPAARPPDLAALEAALAARVALDGGGSRR